MLGVGGDIDSPEGTPEESEVAIPCPPCPEKLSLTAQSSSLSSWCSLEGSGDPEGDTVTDDDNGDFVSDGAGFEWAPSGWLPEEAAPPGSCFDGADGADGDDDTVDEGEDGEAGDDAEKVEVENRA